jgi:hypothetical protein|tara:strand:+ start:399 stop:1007 length:609 start_codon:yes stop_codon:yes gene_type:complete
MKKRDYQRVESLSKEMWHKSIMFSYFITILYEKPVTDETIVAVDNKHLKLLLRRKFKKNISFLFTNEKHLKNDQSKWFNSYHRHILMSEIDGVSCEDLENFIRKHHKSVSIDLINHDTMFATRKGIVIEPVKEFNLALSYVTKQIEYPQLNVDRDKVIDASNSDIGKNHYSVRGDHRDNRDRDLCRPRTIPKTTNRFLSVVH